MSTSPTVESQNELLREIVSLQSKALNAHVSAASCKSLGRPERSVLLWNEAMRLTERAIKLRRELRQQNGAIEYASWLVLSK